jgi:hypothetical protein
MENNAVTFWNKQGEVILTIVGGFADSEMLLKIFDNDLIRGRIEAVTGYAVDNTSEEEVTSCQFAD